MKKLITTLLFLICISLALPSFAENLNFINVYNSGIKSFQAKKYDCAIKDFSLALKYNPKSYKTLCFLGMSYGSKGDAKNAEKFLKEAVKLYPNQWNAYTFLGDMRRAEHNHPVAIEYYKKAISLPSMPPEYKGYYQKIIEQIKVEQLARNAKASQIDLIKNNVDLNIDSTKWVKAYETGNDKNWLVEYGLNGEDVKGYHWTKLITIQYYENNFCPYAPSEYLTSHLAPIQKMAQDTHKNFEKNIISQNSNEIVYEWSFDNGEESEVARLIKTGKGLYHLHFAKKGVITPDEKSKWLNVLKTAKINE